MKITITGPNGAMGRALIQALTKRDSMHLFGAVGKANAAYVGEDAGLIAGGGKALGTAITADAEAAMQGSDLVIDFSSPAVSLEILAHADRLRIPLICGTTGFTPQQRAQFAEAAGRIPVLLAANTSRVIHLMRRFLVDAATALPKAEIEIIDMHARTKKDAPSGTALEMAETLAAARNISFDNDLRYGRKGQQNFDAGEIGMHSVRSGDVPSTHTVWFGLPGERLEITHHATGMASFAEGALDAAEFLYGKDPGLYTMEDVFGER